MSDDNKTACNELKEALRIAHGVAERAAYSYFCALPIGNEREQAYEVYERIRNATRLCP